MASPSDCIVKACEDSWEEKTSAGIENKNNCSGFAKAVLSKLGIDIPPGLTADGIVDFLEGRATKLKSGQEAAAYAAQGKLVVAALKAADHSPARGNGHVAIVVPGALYRSIYPKVWGGSIGGAQSRGNKSTGEVWNRADRDNVVFYHLPSIICPK